MHPPLQAFSADLAKLFTSLQAIDTQLIIDAGSGGVSAQVAADDAAVNRFLLDLVRCGWLPSTCALVVPPVGWPPRATQQLGRLQQAMRVPP